MKENYWIIELKTLDDKTRDIVNEFLKNMKLANKSPVTIDKYRRVLGKFFTECPKPLQQLCSDDVLNWLRTFMEIRKRGRMSMSSPFYQAFLSTARLRNILTGF